MKESLFVICAWVVLIDGSILFCYFVHRAFRRAARKLLDKFLISDNIGAEKTDKV